jgi:DNA ligase-1
MTPTDLADGESTEMQGSAATPYKLTNTGGVYSCTCPAWRNQGVAIERRTCKHLKKLRGDAAEAARVGGDVVASRPARKANAEGTDEEEAEDKAPPLLLAHSWENEQDLSGWWMSEKLDGVRAYWDGTRFLSRLGNVYHAPDWFLEGLPAIPLDGELWGGRKKFQRTVSIARRQDKSDLWRELSFLVFDAPSHQAGFEERLELVRQTMRERMPKHAKHHEHVRCNSTEHLRQELARVEALGGEGLMLRQPGSRYEAGRSHTLLKVKSFKDDEARVIAHLPGEGKHKGKLGAVVVEMGNGTTFSVGTGFSEKERKAPPPIGAVITFRYQELSDGGVPRFPTYVGLRDDVTLPKPSTPTSTPTRTPTPTSTSTSTSTSTRRFEMVEGTSSKFWEISVEGACHVVRFGRIGTEGQLKEKTFASASAAQADAEKLIDEKTRKGYAET